MGRKKSHREDVGGVAKNVLQGPARAAATERDELKRRQRTVVGVGIRRTA